MSTFKVKAVNDDRDYCECCGRKNLKKVAWIENEETGEIKHFGVVCATAPAKGFDLEREMKEAVSLYERNRAIINSLTYNEYRKQGGKFAPIDGNGVFKMLDRPLYEAIRVKIKERHPL